MNRNRNTENPFNHVLKAQKRAGKYAVGTVRTHGGVKKRKMADGSWQPMGGKGAKPKTRRATIETRTPARRYHAAQAEIKRGAKDRDDGWAIKYAEVYAAAMNKHGVNAKVWQKKTGKGTITRVYFFGTFIDMRPTGFTSETDDSAYKLAHLWQNSSKKIASGEAEYARSKARKALDRQREAEGDEAFRLIHEKHGTSDVDPLASASKVDPAVTRESEMIEAAKTGKLTQAMGEVYPGISWSEKDMKRIHSLLKVDPAEAGEYAAFFGERHAKKARKSHGVEQLSPLSKGKKYPIGTVRTHGGVKKRKTAQGWVTVKPRKKKKAQTEGSRKKVEPEKNKPSEALAKKLHARIANMTAKQIMSIPPAVFATLFPAGEVSGRRASQREVEEYLEPSPKQAKGVAKALMGRAAQMLQSVDASDAITRLLDDGYTESQAYLAVKAGKLLNRFRQERMKSHGGMELSSDDELWAMEKGRKNLPVGSKRTRKDGRTYIKQRNGEWRLIEEQKKKRGRKTGSTAKERVARKRAPVKKRPATAKKRDVSSKEDPNKAAIRIARLVGASEGAKRIGVAEGTFRKWAQGKSPVPQKHIKRLEKVFAEAKRAEGKAEGGQEGKEEYTKKRSRKPMRDDPKSEKEGLRWQTRLERATRPFFNLIKAAVPGAGWEPIRRPRGGKVGFRRRKKSGKGYDYFYPGVFTGKLGKEGQAVKPTKEKKKEKKKKVVQKERHTGIATTTEQIRSKYGHLGVGNVPVDSDRVDKDGNVVKKAVDLKKAQFVDLNPADPSTKPCFKWKDLSVNPPDGKWKYGRARSLGQTSAGDKFDRVSKLLPNMRGIGAALGKVVSDEGASQNHRDAAAAIAIMADTGSRIGHIRHLKTSGTRGALTLYGKDIRISKAGVFLEFSGKGGKKNVAKITNPAVEKYLRERVRGADKDGRVFDCTLRDMENVRDKAGYAEHIFHDFRTARATILAADELASSPKPPPPLPKNKEDARALIMERVSAASIVVGSQLNNTPSMALESYIHPSVLWAYIQDVGGEAVAESFFKKSGDGLDGLTGTKGGARLLRMAMSLKMPGPRGAQWSKEDLEIQPDVMDSYPLPDGLLKK
jgi:hypothetical protein